jgi:hypothetical protein
MDTMSISRDIAARSPPSKAFRPEEWHFQIQISASVTKSSLFGKGRYDTNKTQQRSEQPQLMPIFKHTA